MRINTVVQLSESSQRKHFGSNVLLTMTVNFGFKFVVAVYSMHEIWLTSIPKPWNVKPPEAWNWPRTRECRAEWVWIERFGTAWVIDEGSHRLIVKWPTDGGVTVMIFMAQALSSTHVPEFLPEYRNGWRTGCYNTRLLDISYPNLFVTSISPHWSSWALSDTVSFTFTYHTWQFIIIFLTIFTITTCILSYSFSLTLWT